MMKIISALGLMLVATPALAQTTPADTGGAYVGAHVAWSDRYSDWLDLGVGPLGSHHARGPQVGVQIGYDLDLGPAFIGARANFSPVGQSGNHVDQVFGYSTIYTERQRSVERWRGEAIARLGTRLGRQLVYAKGGLALSRKYYALTGYFGPDVVFAETTDTRSGWVIGAGVERRVSRRFSAFIDYGYADFGRKLENIRCTPRYPNCGSLDPSLVPVVLKESSPRVEFGINYHF